jgi:NAD-dependent DNA ligase
MGLGIRQVGQHIARVLAKQFGTLSKLMSATQEELLQVREIGPEISASLASFFSEERNRAVIARLIERGLTIAPPTTENTSRQPEPGRQDVRLYRWAGRLQPRPSQTIGGTTGGTGLVECQQEDIVCGGRDRSGVETGPGPETGGAGSDGSGIYRSSDA